MLVSSDTILAIELAKIQNDFKGAFALEDDALVAKPSYFEKCEIYARDLILNTRPGIPLKSKLLDESFKVIYIDCTEFFPEKGQFLVRLPSPKMLNLMTKNLPSGELVYPRIADLMSRILDVCMDPRRSNLQLIGNIKRYRETGRPGGLIARYMTEVKQLLNTRENYMKTLIQPVCSGIAPKQMVDKFIPHGICVVLNDRVYDSLKRKTWGELADEREDFYVLGLRNPVLWTAMMQRLTVWSAKQWDEHLQANHGVTLEDYLCVEHCQHLMMMNIIDMLQPQADADGDLFPIMVVPGEVAQQELETAFVSRVVHIKSGNLVLERSVNVLPTVNAEELGWIFGKQLADGEYQDGYTQGEISSDAKLFDHEAGVYKELPQYKLNTAVFDWNEQGAALPYNKLLCNAVIAKNKVATGTLELWHVNSGTEIFRHYYKKSEAQYGRGAFSRRDTIQGMLANNGVLTPFDNTDWGLMSHMYSRIVQDFIVRGIKHQANGSSGADIFLLENTTAVGSSNTMSEAKRALQDLGYSREQVNKLMFMIKWLAAEGYLDALKHYVRFYNRGTVIGERDRKEFEQQLKDIDMLTVNGRIMSPYSDVLKTVDSFTGRVMAQKSVGNAVVSSGGVLSFSGNAMLVA